MSDQSRVTPDELASLHGAPLFRPGSTVPGTAAPSLPPQGGFPHGNSPEMHRRARRGDMKPGWLRRSLRASMVEGMLAEIVAACAGGGLVTGWAIELGCGPVVLALFGALPFLSQLVHLPTSWFTARRHRRGLALASLTASRQLLLGLAALPLLNLTKNAEQALFATIVGVSSVLGVIGNNAWMSWMGDIVPGRVRARYFSMRSTFATVAGAFGALGSGMVLDAARRAGNGQEALGALSVIAWIAGIVCTVLIAKQSDPGPSPKAASLRLRDLLKPWSCPEARPVLAYQLVWNAAIGVAASFFGLFLLRDLRVGFTFMALHGAVIAGVRALSLPLWGKALDRVGTRPVLVTTSFGIALLPFLWLLPDRHDFLAPLAVDAVMSGIMWSGHGLASFQLPHVVSPNESRPFYFAAFASMGGVAFAVAAIAGGVLLPMLPRTFELGGQRLGALHGVFLLSAVLRLTAWLLSLRVREKAAKPVPQLWRGLGWWPEWLRIERLLPARVPVRLRSR